MQSTKLTLKNRSLEFQKKKIYCLLFDDLQLLIAKIRFLIQRNLSEILKLIGICLRIIFEISSKTFFIPTKSSQMRRMTMSKMLKRFIITLSDDLRSLSLLFENLSRIQQPWMISTNESTN